jgi:hypothetical protein
MLYWVKFDISAKKDYNSITTQKLIIAIVYLHFIFIFKNKRNHERQQKI